MKMARTLLREVASKLTAQGDVREPVACLPGLPREVAEPRTFPRSMAMPSPPELPTSKMRPPRPTRTAPCERCAEPSHVGDRAGLSGASATDRLTRWPRSGRT